MKQPVGIFQRGQRLQRVLDWLTSPWPPVDGDWRPPETLLHRFIKEELGEHFVIDPIPYSKGLQENSLALEFMEPPLTTKVWWRPLWEQLNGPKLPPSVMHPVPAQMDELHAQMSRMVWAVSRGDAFVFELRPYSVKYNVRAGTVGGKLRYLTNPEGSLGTWRLPHSCTACKN